MNTKRVSECVQNGFLKNIVVAGLFSYVICNSPGLLAQVTTAIIPDATLPGGSHSLVLPSGSRVDIAGGHAAGSNLFHSFADFHVGAGDTANFFGQGASNILSRVTGSNPSNIFGTLGIDTHLPEGSRSTANLFFLNPNGVVFGPTSSLDLKGSFHVSTADYIRLGPGANDRFSATANNADNLISADPIAFGFLSQNRGPITINGNFADGEGTKLGVNPGKTLSVVGGSIEVNNTLMQAPSGQINLVSLASSGELSVESGAINGFSTLSIGDSTAKGNISLDASEFNVNSLGTIPSGRVLVRAGHLVLDNSKILATQDRFLDEGGGFINITANDINLKNGAEIRADTGDEFTSNSAQGIITINTDRLTSNVFRNPDKTIRVNPFTGLPMGEPESAPVRLSSSGGEGIITIRGINGEGKKFVDGSDLALQIALHKTEILAVGSDVVSLPGSFVTLAGETMSYSDVKISTAADGGFQAGNILLIGEQINGNNLRLDVGGNHSSISGTIDIEGKQLVFDQLNILATTDGGVGGSILLKGDDLIMRNSIIDSESSVHGNPGRIIIQGLTEQAVNSGQLENVNLLTTNLALVDTDITKRADTILTVKDLVLKKTNILSQTASTAAGGDIVIIAETLLGIDSSIDSSSLGSTGSPGTIRIQGLSGPSEKITFNRTTVSTISGEGGVSDNPPANITVTAKDVILNSSVIQADTRGQAPAGDITLNVDQLSTSGIFAPGQAASGPTPSLVRTTISSRSGLEADQRGFADHPASGTAGTITIQGSGGAETKVAGFIELNQTDITTEALDTGGGGSINIKGQQEIRLTDTNLLATVTDRQPGEVPTSGLANLLINGRLLTMADSTLAAETRGNRDAGNLSVSSSSSTTLHQAALSSSSIGTDALGGNAGSVTIGSTGPMTSTKSTVSTRAVTGAGGAIQLLSGGALVLDATTVSAAVEGGEQAGGSITVQAGASGTGGPAVGNAELQVRNGTTLTAKSSGLGNAGNIHLEAGGTLRLQNATIETDAAKASGGDIKLTADFLIGLSGSQLEASVQGGEGTQGGNIDIDPEFVVIQTSDLRARANEGLGGNINIISDVFLVDAPISTFDVSSQFGISGTIVVSSPIQNLSQTIAPLPQTMVEVTALYSAQCAGQKGGAFSSFTVQSRDRIPLEPGEMLPTPLALASLASSRSPISERPISPMVQRFSLPSFEGSLFSQSLRDIFIDGCHS